MRKTLKCRDLGLEAPIDARQLFQPNAQTISAFEGDILGWFIRNGPNAWDSYQFQSGSGGKIRVFPGIKVVIAPHGAVFRMRAKGRVLRVAWRPEDPDMAQQDPRAMLLEHCVRLGNTRRGVGAAALIAKTLDKGRPSGR